GLSCLVVAPAGEPLLALSARLRPPLHVSLTDLVLLDPVAGQPGDGEAALAHEQHAPALRGRRGADEVVGPPGAVGPPVQAEVRGERRAVRGLTHQRTAADRERGVAVARREVVDPAHEALGRDADLGHEGAVTGPSPDLSPR